MATRDRYAVAGSKWIFTHLLGGRHPLASLTFLSSRGVDYLIQMLVECGIRYEH